MTPQRNGPAEWTAAEVKDKLRGRHPATQAMGVRQIPGPWTCIEEWDGVDLLAFGCHGPRHRIGYEVKVSRSDYRSELDRPDKRAPAVAACHRFYFAVPRGLLKPEEIDATEAQLTLGASGKPLWVPEDVGLVVVDGRGCRVEREAPFNHSPEDIIGGRGDGMGSDLHNLIRWVSARPDPRHEGVVEAARERMKELRDDRRERERQRREAAEAMRARRDRAA